MKVEKTGGVNGKEDDVLNKNSSGRHSTDEVLNNDLSGQRSVNKDASERSGEQDGARPAKRSVYFPQYRQAISTAYPSAAEVNYAAQMTLAKRNRDNYFALERLDVSVPDRTRSILEQGVKALSGVTADMVLTLKRSVLAGAENLADWQYLHKQRTQAARERMEGKLTDTQAAARFMQIQSDYQRLRDMGRRSMDIIQKNDERFLERAGLVRDEKDGFTYDLMSGAGTLLGALVVSAATKNPATAAAIFGVYAGRKDYEEAVQNGVTPGRAMALSIAGGLAEGGLELAGLDFLERLFKAKGVLGAAVKGFASEALQEGAQQTAEEIIMQNFGGREQDFDDTLYAIGFSALIGGLLGAPAAAVGNIGSRLLQGKGVPEPAADKLAEAALRAAADERVQAQAEEILKQATSSADFVNADVQQSITQFAKVTGAQARQAQKEIYETGRRVEQEALAAGVAADEARALGRLETARAVSMLNTAGVMPQALTQVHITRGGLNPAGALRQSAAAMYRNPAASLEEFVDKARKQKGQQKDSYYTVYEGDGFYIDLKSTTVRHDKKHPNMTPTRWRDAVNHLENIEDYTSSAEDLKAGQLGTVLLKIQGREGKYGVALDIFENGRVFAESVFDGTDVTLEQWIEEQRARNQKKKAAGTPAPRFIGVGQALQKSKDVISGQPSVYSLTEIIQTVKGQTLFQTERNIAPQEITQIHNQVTGQAIALEMYVAGRENEEVSVIEAGKALFNGKTDREVNKHAVRKQVLHGQKNITLKNKNGKEYRLSVSSVDKMFSSIFENLNGEALLGKKEIIARIADIFPRLEPILSHKDINGLDRQIERFAGIVRMEERDYYVMAVAKDGHVDKVRVNTLYDLQMQANKKAPTDIPGEPGHKGLIYTIGDLVRFVKGKIAKYNRHINNAGQTFYQRGRGTGADMFAPQPEVAERFKEDVQKALSDQSVAAGTLFDMGNLPGIYVELGLPPGSLKTNKTTLLKATGKAGRNLHDVPQEVLENLPALVADPLAVFKSSKNSQNPLGYVAVLNAKNKDGKQIIAVISPKGGKYDFSFIPSVYERNNFDNFVRNTLREKGVLYVKDETVHPSLHNAVLRENTVSNNRILTKEDFVKPETLFQRPNEPLASVSFDPDNNAALLRLFSSANRSSAVHEFAHVWRRDLLRAERLSTEEDFLNLVRDLRQWDAQSYEFVKSFTLRPNNGLTARQRQSRMREIDQRGGAEYVRRVAFAPAETGNEDVTDAWVRRAFDENFAECFELYLAKGKAPSEGLRGLFERFAEWLRDLYDQVRDFVRLTPQVQSLFDRLLSSPSAQTLPPAGKYRGKAGALREVVKGLKKRRAVKVDGMGIKELKELLAVTRRRIPAAPKEDLLLTLRREGADYAHAAAVDAEAYANAYVFNKKGGIGNDMARWLADRGYMEPLAENASYEDKAAKETEAAQLVSRALAGEKIYKLADAGAAAAREEFMENVRTVKEILGDTDRAEEILRQINSLENEGYRVVEKSDLDFMERQLRRLEEAPQKDAARAARRVLGAVEAEVEKRDIENKQDMLRLLHAAQTPDEIYAAVEGVLGQLESAYEQTEEGARQRRILEVPDTDYGKIKTAILRDINRIYKESDEELRRADELLKLRSAQRRGEITLSEEQREEVRRAEKVIENRGTSLYRAAIEAALKGIRHLPAADKGKFIASLASYRQPWRLALEIDGLLQRVKEIEERNYKKRVAAAVERILKESVLEREGRLRKSTVDAETGRVLQQLRHILRLTPSQAQSELAQRADYFAENAPSKADLIQNRLLNYKAKDLDDISPQAMRALYDDLRALKTAGREAMGLQKLISDVRTELEKKEVLAAVRANKPAGALKKLYANAVANWESLINLITNKELAQKYSLLMAESDAQVADFQAREKVLRQVGEAYGITEHKELMKKLRELNEEKYTVINYAQVDDRPDPYVIRRTGEPFKQELTKAEIMTLYIWNMNFELGQRIARAYGEGQREMLFSKLDQRDRLAARVLQEAAQEQYQKINEVFVRTRGYDLPRAEHYFPSQTERVESELDFLATASEISRNPSFIKRRIDSAYVQMRPENPFAILFRHFSRAAAYVHKSEKINQLRRVLRSPAVKPAIVENFGQDTYKVMLELLDNSAVGSKSKYSYSAAQAMNWLTNNYVKSAIAAKPTIVLKQLIAVINYSEDMPAKEWARGFVRGLKTPEKTLRFMMSGDPYLKVRLESGGQNEALARAVADAKNPSKLDGLSSFTDILTATTRYGDLGAVAFGGYPYVRYLMAQGKTKKEAFDLFRQATLRGQQANVKSSLSRLQAQDMNWFTRALFAFRNTPSQYVRKIADAAVQYQRGEISKAQLAKTLAIYGLLNSWLYSMSTSLGLLKFALGEGGDDLAEEIFLSPMVQFFGLMPFVDEIASQTSAQLMSLAWQGKLTRLRAPAMPLLEDLYGSVNHLLKKEVSFTDWVDFTVDLAQPVTGLPTRYVKGLATGAQAAWQGEPLRAWLQLLGYTEHRAAVVTGTKK